MLSNKTKYAIKALIAICHSKTGLPVHIYDIAESENIPQKFLELIMLDLKRAGLIDSKRGKGGGYFFVKDPGDIRMGDVIRYFEGPIALLPCASVTKYRKCKDCKDEEACQLRRFAREVRDMTAEFMDRMSLREMAGDS